MSREFLPGQVIDYPYLWAWQQERGETEGTAARLARDKDQISAMRRHRARDRHEMMLPQKFAANAC